MTDTSRRDGVDRTDGELHVRVNSLEGTSLEGLGEIAVGTTPVKLVFSDVTEKISIGAGFLNSGLIYWGDSTVDSSGNNSFRPLERKDIVTLNYNDFSGNDIYVVASEADQTAWIGAIK